MDDLETRAARYMFQSKLAFFFSLAFRLLYPGVTYQQHWSITVLGEALSRCFKGDTQRLIINMPPRSLKSFCASVAFPPGPWLVDRKRRSSASRAIAASPTITMPSHAI